MENNTILFESFDDMKPFLSAAFGEMNILSLQSDLDNSLGDIELMTGKDLLATLITNYREEDATEAELALIEKVRKPLANMAFYKHSNSGSLSISDTGYTTPEDSTSKRPYQWQIRNFQRQRLADYAAGMNELWVYLQANTSDFSDWVDTDEYKYLKFRPISELKQWAEAGRRIANWRTHYAVLPEMNMVWQDIAIIIGQGLLDAINEWIEDGMPESDYTGLMVYIRRYVAHATIERASNTLPLSIEAEGVLLNEVDTTTANSDKVTQDKAMLMAGAEREACKAKNRLIDYLYANATADLFEPFYTQFILNTPEKTVLNQDGDKILLL